MDAVKIVLLANAGYMLLIMLLLAREYSDYKDKIESKDRDVANLYTGYNPWFVFTIFLQVIFAFLRNGHIFNDYFPVMFIVQFGLQLLYFILFLLPKKEILLHLTIGVLGLIWGAAAYNGLFTLPRKFTPLELTIKDLNKLSDEVETFNSDLSEKMSAINKNMTAVVAEIKNRENELKRVNEIIEEKKSEVGELKSVVEIDERRAEEILNALNYRPPTLRDKVIDHAISFVLGIMATLFYERFLSRFLKRKSSP